MWMKYRMRCFQSAFHANADQETWYGWGPLKETAVVIKSEDKRLRAEAELEEAVGTRTPGAAERAAEGAGAAESPGFGAVFSFASILALFVLMRRNR